MNDKIYNIFLPSIDMSDEDIFIYGQRKRSERANPDKSSLLTTYGGFNQKVAEIINENQKIALINRALKNNILYYTGENFLPNLDQKPVVIKQLMTQSGKAENYSVAEIDFIETGFLYPATRSVSCFFEEINPSKELDKPKIFHTIFGEAIAGCIGPDRTKMVGRIFGYKYGYEEEIKKSIELQSQAPKAQELVAQTRFGRHMEQYVGPSNIRFFGEKVLGLTYPKNES